MFNYFLHNPVLNNNEIKYVNDCLKTAWITNGKYINKFSELLKKYTKSKYVIPCANGTSALHIALKVIGVRKDDEVMVPTTTFIAPVNAIKYNLANPIFFDIDDNFTIDTDKVIEFLNRETVFKNGNTYNKKTKKIIRAIIVVHTFGNAVNIHKLLSLCRTKKIKIVEDAAESLGTFYTKYIFRGKHTGTIGDIGCISFNSNKIITMGGGGAILTKSKKISDKCSYLINQAKDDNIKYIHNEIGFNYRLNNISAAIGYAQLQNINKILNNKKKINQYYFKYLNKKNYYGILNYSEYYSNNNWLNILKFERVNYNIILSLINKLNDLGIETRPIWYANHLQKPYKKYQNYKITNAIKMQNNCVCLPSSSSLTEKDIKIISKSIINIL